MPPLASDLAHRMAETLNQGPRPVDLDDVAGVVMRLAWSGFLIKEIGDSLDAAIGLAHNMRTAATAEPESAL